jgi:hypothetical protein
MGRRFVGIAALLTLVGSCAGDERRTRPDAALDASTMDAPIDGPADAPLVVDAPTDGGGEMLPERWRRAPSGEPGRVVDSISVDYDPGSDVLAVLYHHNVDVDFGLGPVSVSGLDSTVVAYAGSSGTVLWQLWLSDTGPEVGLAFAGNGFVAVACLPTGATAGTHTVTSVSPDDVMVSLRLGAADGAITDAWEVIGPCPYRDGLGFDDRTGDLLVAARAAEAVDFGGSVTIDRTSQRPGFVLRTTGTGDAIWAQRLAAFRVQRPFVGTGGDIAVAGIERAVTSSTEGDRALVALLAGADGAVRWRYASEGRASSYSAAWAGATTIAVSGSATADPVLGSSSFLAGFSAETGDLTWSGPSAPFARAWPGGETVWAAGVEVDSAGTVLRALAVPISSVWLVIPSGDGRLFVVGSMTAHEPVVLCLEDP